MEKKGGTALRFLYAVCVIAVFALTWNGTVSDAHAKTKYVADELLIQVKAGVPKTKMKEILGGLGAFTEAELPRIRVKRIKVPSHALEKVKSALSKNPHINFVEQNYIADIVFTPNDEKFPSQWHLPKISAPQGWDMDTGSPDVSIAIIDSGISETHPDLSSKLIPGYNFLDRNTNTDDIHGHGTMVAGSAAALSNNFIGVAGVAWENPIMPLLVVNPSGWATYYDIASAITYAADNNVKIMNISIAGSSSSLTLQIAVNYAWNRGAVIFAAAGNSATNIPYYPAACTNVVAVSATNSNDSRASFSNYGDWVDISAPGVSILTTTRSGGYSSGSGTSFSSPIAAGLGALIMSANPYLTNVQVVDIVQQHSDDIGNPGFDPYFGNGRINVYESLVAAHGTVPEPDTTPPSAVITFPADGSTVSGIITVRVSATDDTGVTDVELYINGSLYATDTTEPYNFSWNTGMFPDGSYELIARAYDSAGNTGQSNSVTVNVDNTVPEDTIPPFVSILSPKDGSKAKRNMNIKVSASDNVGVDHVEIYIDSKLKHVATSDTDTYAWRWDTRNESSGEHTIMVKAYDAAGNSGTDSSSIYKSYTSGRKNSKR